MVHRSPWSSVRTYFVARGRASVAGRPFRVPRPASRKDASDNESAANGPILEVKPALPFFVSRMTGPKRTICTYGKSPVLPIFHARLDADAVRARPTTCLTE